jgi:hypothetical protein
VRDAGTPTCLEYTLDFLLSGWTDGKVRAHDCETARALWQIDHAHRGGVTALKLSHNERSGALLLFLCPTRPLT